MTTYGMARRPGRFQKARSLDPSRTPATVGKRNRTVRGGILGRRACNVANAGVLIVGAGRTGLTLAPVAGCRSGWFARLTGRASIRALWWPRTVEFYGRFGFADEVVRQGIQAGQDHLRKDGENGR